MSGTSLDGIDAALVRIRPQAHSYRIDLLNFACVPFEDAVLARLRATLPPHRGSVEDVAFLHRALGEAFASAALAVQSDTPIDYVASHGQTMWHDGNARITLQLGDAFIIRERVGATVCYDFRSADTAAGGQGAPLVPYADALLMRSEREERIALNIGGIANVTVLPRGSGLEGVAAFDTGPGNMLIDAFVHERTQGRERYDCDGALGLRGHVNATVLQSLLRDPFFSLPPPKSTGRERFGAPFLHEHAALLATLTLEDGAATLAALTAASIADAVRRLQPAQTRLLVSGGGACNQAILAQLRERLPSVLVERSDALNIHPDAKEAMAFALLGYEVLRERTANLPSVTGAAHQAVLGALAPHNLARLRTKMEAECR